MKKIKLILFMFLALAVSSCDIGEEEYAGDQTNSDSTTGTGTGGTGTSGGIYNGSKPTGNYWSRNDGAGTAYLSLSGSTAKACSSGKETIGTFNSSKPSMTFTIGTDVLEFPLLYTNGLLIVGVPNQAVTTNNPTQYVATSNYPCGAGGATTAAKGTIMIWTSATTSYACGFDSLNVEISGTSSASGTIYIGHYTQAPQCGSTYCYTKEVVPGTYYIKGIVYPFKLLNGQYCQYTSAVQTVTVYSNQCTKVKL